VSRILVPADRGSRAGNGRAGRLVLGQDVLAGIEVLATPEAL
jgi:hypothetical protein